jgi:hypothetical protein
LRLIRCVNKRVEELDERVVCVVCVCHVLIFFDAFSRERRVVYIDKSA